MLKSPKYCVFFHFSGLLDVTSIMCVFISNEMEPSGSSQYDFLTILLRHKHIWKLMVKEI